MLQRIAHIILSCWLALLLLFGGTAKEFIHQFTGHEDTQHIVHSDGLAFENEHHHCDFLNYSLPPFINDFIVPSTDFVAIDYNRFVEIYNAPVSSEKLYQLHSRGPPALV